MRFSCLLIAVVAAVALAAVGFVRGTYAAGGSDSSCYALMADALGSGRLQPSSALVATVPWPDAPQTFAPGGFVASQHEPSAFAPVCAPGFSLLVAPVLAIAGSNAFFWVTPVAGALLVWLGFLAGRKLAGPVAGAMSAVLLASSPVVLYQVVQPMNDVATTALWMAVFVSLIHRRWGLAGACCGLALLVRPNLLPLAAVSGLFVLAESRIPNHQSRVPSLVWFCTAAVPGGLLVLWMNAQLYSGPLGSGYGDLGYLFGFSNLAVNLARYMGWLLATETPFPFLALAAPWVCDRQQRPACVLALGLSFATAFIYLIYQPFDDWSYLRFLMPALALLLVLASSVTARLTARLVDPAGNLVAAAVALALCVFGVRTAEDRLAFTMQALEQRYRSAGLVVRDRLPADAVVLSVWDSGAVRFHGRKEALNWEGLDPQWLDRGLEWLRQQGHAPYILVESWEEPSFRSRFGAHSAVGNLDWPPKYEIDRVVRIYDPEARAAYMRGEPVGTEYLWPLRRKEP